MNAAALTFYQALRRRLSAASKDADNISARTTATVLPSQSEVIILWERIHRLELLADALNTYSSRLEHSLVDR